MDKLIRGRNNEYLDNFKEHYIPGSAPVESKRPKWILFSVLSLVTVAIIAHFCLQRIDKVLATYYPDEQTALSLYAHGIALPDEKNPGAAPPTPTDDMCRALAHKSYGFLADFPVKAEWKVGFVKNKRPIPVCRVENHVAYTDSIPKKKLYGSLLYAALGILAAGLSTLVLKRLFHREA